MEIICLNIFIVFIGLILTHIDFDWKKNPFSLNSVPFDFNFITQ